MTKSAAEVIHLRRRLLSILKLPEKVHGILPLCDPLFQGEITSSGDQNDRDIAGVGIDILNDLVLLVAVSDGHTNGFRRSL